MNWTSTNVPLWRNDCDSFRKVGISARACLSMAPDSLAWEIGRESALFLGGGKAALLQLAHPFVAHAIDREAVRPGRFGLLTAATRGGAIPPAMPGHSHRVALGFEPGRIGLDLPMLAHEVASLRTQLGLELAPAGTLPADLAARVAPGRTVGVDTAADVVAAARDHARERGATNVEVVPGDFRRLDLAPGSFDVVHAHQVLQHLSEPVAALAEMRRGGRPGGVVAARGAGGAGRPAARRHRCHRRPGRPGHCRPRRRPRACPIRRARAAPLPRTRRSPPPRRRRRRRPARRRRRGGARPRVGPVGEGDGAGRHEGGPIALRDHRGVGDRGRDRRTRPRRRAGRLARGGGHGAGQTSRPSAYRSVTTVGSTRASRSGTASI